MDEYGFQGIVSLVSPTDGHVAMLIVPGHRLGVSSITGSWWQACRHCEPCLAGERDARGVWHKVWT